MTRPDLVIDGFRLWIRGREFEDSDDDRDGNWARVVAQVTAPGAQVEAEGALLHLSEFQQFRNECQAVHDTLQGEAVLRLGQRSPARPRAEPVVEDAPAEEDPVGVGVALAGTVASEDPRLGPDLRQPLRVAEELRAALGAELPAPLQRAGADPARRKAVVVGLDIVDGAELAQPALEAQIQAPAVLLLPRICAPSADSRE